MKNKASNKSKKEAIKRRKERKQKESIRMIAFSILEIAK